MACRRTKRTASSHVDAAVLAQVLHERENKGRLDAVLVALPKGEPLSDVTVEGLKEAYLPFVVRLNLAGLPVPYDNSFYQEGLEAGPWAKVALWKGCVIGAAICQVSQEIPGTVHVRSLVSSVPRRRVATLLLEAIFAEARKHEMFKSSIRVHIGNPGGIAFYASLGYRVKQTLVGYYEYSKHLLDGPPDALFMLRDEAGGAPAKRAADIGQRSQDVQAVSGDEVVDAVVVSTDAPSGSDPSGWGVAGPNSNKKRKRRRCRQVS